MARNLSLPVIAKLAAADLRAIREYDYQVAITKYLESDGWAVQYFRKSAVEGKDGRWRGLGGAGWPDVIAVKGPRMLALEVKSEAGRPTPEQRVWIAALNGVPGIEAMVVKPRDAYAVMVMLR